MRDTSLFIEETRLDMTYMIVWRQPENVSVNEAFAQALFQLSTLPGTNRLELWSKAHAASPKGFAPMAFRDKDSSRIMVANTLKMLMPKTP